MYIHTSYFRSDKPMSYKGNLVGKWWKMVKKGLKNRYFLDY